MKRLIIVLVTIVSLSTMSIAFAAVKKASEEQARRNVIASQLIGSWETDVELNKRLGSEFTLAKDGPLIFEEEDGEEFIDSLSNELKEFLADKVVYLTGRAKFADKSFPFLLGEYAGCPMLFIQTPNDLEGVYLMFARGKEAEGDLLFLGGDQPGETFSAYKRVSQAE